MGRLGTYRVVSIPLRFDSYTRRKSKTFPLASSQFHYGSIHTNGSTLSMSILWGSQFHYGSIHTKIPEKDYVKLLWLSQFHYGSIHTALLLLTTKQKEKVSIPLRFDSYLSSEKIRQENYARLNSTTVRFIQSKRGRKSKADKEVSIPLRFDSYCHFRTQNIAFSD